MTTRTKHAAYLGVPALHCAPPERQRLHLLPADVRRRVSLNKYAAGCP